MNNGLSGLYRRFQGEIEDFWGRKDHVPGFWAAFRIFGRRVRISSNHERVLAAGELSRLHYSMAPEDDREPFEFCIIVRTPEIDPGPLPADISERMIYTGANDWITINLGYWGQVYADLPAGKGIIVLSPQFAERPECVSRYILNTLINNMLTRHGFSMLHATAMIRNGCTLLLLADHNQGKSTTALHLVHAGYALFSDSQVYVTIRDGGLQLTGFPVGRAKLRPDMVSQFPGIQPFLTTERVRDELKHVVDMRLYRPASVWDHAIVPGKVSVCLLSISDTAETKLTRVNRITVMNMVMTNSLHFDRAPLWIENLERIDRLINQADPYILSVGTDIIQLVKAVDSLWDGSGSTSQ